MQLPNQTLNVASFIHSPQVDRRRRRWDTAGNVEDTTIDRVVDDTTTGTTEDGDSVDGTTEEEEEEEEVTVGTGIEIEIDDGTMGTTGVDRGTVGTEIGIGIIGGITAVGDRGSVVAALVAAALVAAGRRSGKSRNSTQTPTGGASAGTATFRGESRVRDVVRGRAKNCAKRNARRKVDGFSMGWRIRRIESSSKGSTPRARARTTSERCFAGLESYPGFDKRLGTPRIGRLR